MDFKIRVLRYFVTVAEHSSVTKASEILFVAQPSLSQRIRAFEEQLGFPLFERSHGTITLSSQGKLFYLVAKKLVNSADSAGTIVRNLRSGDVGSLRIGGSWFNLERYVCSTIIDTFTDKFLDVDVIVERGIYSPNILERLRQNELDVAFVVGPTDEREFEALSLPPIDFDFLVPNESPLSKLDSVPLEGLAGTRLAWYRRENNPYIYDAVAVLLSEHGVTVFSPPDTHLNALVHYAQRNRVSTLIGRETEGRPEDMTALSFEDRDMSFVSSLVRLKANKSAIVDKFISHASESLHLQTEQDEH